MSRLNNETTRPEPPPAGPPCRGTGECRLFDLARSLPPKELARVLSGADLSSCALCLLERHRS